MREWQWFWINIAVLLIVMSLGSVVLVTISGATGGAEGLATGLSAAWYGVLVSAPAVVLGSVALLVVSRSIRVGTRVVGGTVCAIAFAVSAYMVGAANILQADTGPYPFDTTPIAVVLISVAALTGFISGYAAIAVRRWKSR